ncbi:MAG TPA: TIM barrel protein [Thermomicrobiales bacterium]|nr:TIM barrel protein [Thermomicrobiales bacterium]
MRLGGPAPLRDSNPGTWISELDRRAYSAAVFPVDHTAPPELVRGLAAAADAAGIVIAEVGAWSNPISADEDQRQEAVTFCQNQLALADSVGARCCVNIAGSRGGVWDGPHPDNLTPQTFDLIVETTREIIDAVRPTRTFFALETMPWIYPDSPESYLRLVRAIDRDRFAVHLDPVNLVCSPQRYFGNDDLIRDCFRMLGPYIRSCHAKDITLATKLTVHLEEVRPGLGALDYAVFLRELSRLDPDTPLILEHLSDAEEYSAAAGYIRGVAAKEGVTFVESQSASG